MKLGMTSKYGDLEKNKERILDFTHRWDFKCKREWNKPHLLSPKGFSIKYALKLSFPTNNNEVEYESMLAGLGLVKALRAKKLKIFNDSQLMVM